jgi:CBS domain-containing protein
MQVKEIMTPDVEVAHPDDTLETVARMMADLDVGVLPVGENDRLVGMITDRDITVRGVAEGLDGNAKVGEAMTRDVHYCFEDEDVEDVSDRMAEWQVRRLPVLNRDKRLVGIVSLGDLAVGSRGEAAQEALRGVSEGSAHAGTKPVRKSGTGPDDLMKGGF